MLLTGAKKGLDFYPTPKICLEDETLQNIFNNVETILEPTAGTGNIIYHLLNLIPTKNIPKIKIDANEINDTIYNILKKQLGEYLNKLTNKNYFDLNINEAYDLTIINPPFTAPKKPQFYKEFFFKAVSDINSNLNKNFNYLVFISPPLIDHRKKDGSFQEKGDFDFGKIWMDMSIKSILKIAEMDKFKLSNKEAKVIKQNGSDVYGANLPEERQDDINEWLESYEMFNAQIIKKCKGFGGTSFQPYVYLFTSYRKN